MEEELKQRYHGIMSRIHKAAKKNGRNDASVQLLAVSKGQPYEKLQALHALGQCRFAESYVQEAEVKINKMKPLGAGLQWHFIGPLQSNKTKKIATLFDWVHSIERYKIAQRLNRHCQQLNKRLNVCLQVNISREASKSGVMPEGVLDLIEQVNALPNLNLRGLMAIPQKNGGNEEQGGEAVPSYQKMAELLTSLKHKGYALDALSMGMSGDFEQAISEGATHLRVGSALFGARNN